MGGDLAASLGGTDKQFLGENFPNDLFKKKFPFHAQKFLWPLFSHRLYFVCLLPVSSVSEIWNNITVLPFPDQNFYFTTRNSSWRPFLASSYFASHPITVVQEILGGRIQGPSPTSNFGDRTPVPPKSPPMEIVNSRNRVRKTNQETERDSK